MQRCTTGLLVLCTFQLHAAALSDQDAPLCGNWQAEYINSHQQILQGKAPPRYAIAVSTYQGFSDRLLGIIGVFYYALLTGRAFQISEGVHTHIMGLESVYAQPSINWTSTQDYARYIRHSKGEEEDVSQSYKYIDALMAPVGDGLSEVLPWLKAHSAKELDMEEQNVLVLLNRGSTQQLFRNHYLEARLSEMGLREDTAFGCAMQFLFRPLPEVEQLMSREFGVLSQSVSQASRLPPPCPKANSTAAKPGSTQTRLGRFLVNASGAPRKFFPEEVPTTKLAIGIHVRLPDDATPGSLQDDVSASHFDPTPFFECAQQIEDEHRCNHQDVVWYLVSDNHHVRATALEQYGKKVLTAVEAKIEHSANKEGRSGEQALSLEGMRTAVGEHWAFGMTDYQVITHHSGYGRTAAFRSMRTKSSLYTINVPDPDTGEPMPTDCSTEGHTTLLTANEHWSGI